MRAKSPHREGTGRQAGGRGVPQTRALPRPLTINAWGIANRQCVGEQAGRSLTLLSGYIADSFHGVGGWSSWSEP